MLLVWQMGWYAIGMLPFVDTDLREWQCYAIHASSHDERLLTIHLGVACMAGLQPRHLLHLHPRKGHDEAQW